MQRILLIALALWLTSLTGCGSSDQQVPTTAMDAEKISKPDMVRYFELDAGQPFHLEFGRGSGMYGLNVIILDETGHATLSRRPGRASERWSQAELQLSVELVAQIVSLINSDRLTNLDRVYMAKGVADGTQWVFTITQGAKRKAVYFDNNFPPAIIHFANALDDILQRGGIDKAIWAPGGGELEQSLWKSIGPGT